jgi:hypothetical protein
MAKYKWTVTGLATETVGTFENYVVVSDFNVVGTNGDYTSTVTGTQTFTIGGDVFIPYEDLTNDLVVGWIKELANVAEITSFIDADLKNQINPPVVPTDKPLPWIEPTDTPLLWS